VAKRTFIKQPERLNLSTLESNSHNIKPFH